MRGEPAPGDVVVVATLDTALAWAAALSAAGVPSRACAPREVAPPADARAATEALARRARALVLATSANATRFLPAGAGRGRHAAAVGPGTARALAAAGFAVDLEGAAGAEDLARRLVAAGPPREVLWLRGERARPEGPALLRAAGWDLEDVVTYRTVALPGFAACLRASPARAHVFGSPRAVEDLAAAWGEEGPEAWRRVPAIAVGATTLQALVDAGVARGVVAAVPTPQAVVAAVRGALCA